MNRFLVAALYKFANLPDYAEMQSPLQRICKENGVKGTLLLAEEGINGTIAGPAEGVRNVLTFIRSDSRLSELEHKESWADGKNPFLRMKVRLKHEIVTMGVSNIDPNEQAGVYVEPEDWNALISDPDVIVIDTRNDYEVEIGTFENAVNPGTASFRDFPEWIRSNRKLDAKPKVAMFCTGGIRCEKASAFMKQEGFDEVYHLKGGILKYLEKVPEADSLWNGECFVFDNRVSVGHGLVPGPLSLCHGCRLPITEDDKRSSHYEEGVCCPKCHHKLTEVQKTRFRERQKQVLLAKNRGEKHIGVD